MIFIIIEILLNREVTIMCFEDENIVFFQNHLIAKSILLTQISTRNSETQIRIVTTPAWYCSYIGQILTLARHFSFLFFFLFDERDILIYFVSERFNRRNIYKHMYLWIMHRIWHNNYKLSIQLWHFKSNLTNLQLNEPTICSWPIPTMPMIAG